MGLGNVTNDAQIPKSLGATKGDLIAFSGSGVPTRIPVGTDTYVLTADGTQTSGIKWAPVTGGSGTSDYLALTDKPKKTLGDTGYGPTIQAALGAIGSNQVTLVIPPGNWAPPASFPANVSVEFSHGAVLDCTTIPHGNISAIEPLDINGGASTTVSRFHAPGHGLQVGDWVRGYGIRQVHPNGDGSSQPQWTGFNMITQVQAATTDYFSVSGGSSGFDTYTDPNGRYTKIIAFNGTLLNSPTTQIFNCPSPCIVFGSLILGSWKAKVQQASLRPEWWGAKGDCYYDGNNYVGTDDFIPLNQCFMAADSVAGDTSVIELSRVYLCSDTLSIHNTQVLNRNSLVIRGSNRYTTGIVSTVDDYPAIEVLSAVGVWLDEFFIHGMNATGGGGPTLGLLICRIDTAADCSMGRYNLHFSGKFQYGSIFNNNGEVNHYYLTDAATVPKITTTVGTTLSSGTILTVGTTTGMKVGAKITVTLDSGKLYSTINSITNSTTLVLADAIPSQATAGNTVMTTRWAFVMGCGALTEFPGIVAKNANQTDKVISSLQNYIHWIDTWGVVLPDRASLIYENQGALEVDKFFFGSGTTVDVYKTALILNRNGSSLKIEGGVTEAAAEHYIKCTADNPTWVSIKCNGTGPGGNSFLYADANSRLQYCDIEVYGDFEAYDVEFSNIKKLGGQTQAGGFTVHTNLAGTQIQMLSNGFTNIPSLTCDSTILSPGNGFKKERYQNLLIGPESSIAKSDNSNQGALFLGSVTNKIEYGWNIPNQGSFYNGNIRWNIQYNGSNPKGWVCSYAGVASGAGTQVGVGSMVQGSYIVTGVTNIGSYSIGDFINVVGAANFATVLDTGFDGVGYTITLNTVASTNVNSVAINRINRTPIFTPIGPITGTFTLAAAPSTTVPNAYVNAANDSHCVITLSPVNAAAATLMGSVKCLYEVVGSRVSNTSFKVATANGAAAAGTEVFYYKIDFN